MALIDIEMPGRSGPDAAAAVRDDLPSCRVLILTAFGRPGYLRRAMGAGASGLLVKDAPVDEFAGASTIADIALRPHLVGDHRARLPVQRDPKTHTRNPMKAVQATRANG